MSENNASARAFYILIHFFSRSLQARTSNDQIVGFVENVNTRQLNFLSVLELENLLYELISWAIHQTILKKSKNCNVVSKSANSFFQ